MFRSLPSIARPISLWFLLFTFARASMLWTRFYKEKHLRVLDRYLNYPKIKKLYTHFEKRFPKKAIYVLYDTASDEEEVVVKEKLMRLGAIEIEPYPQATYVLPKRLEKKVRDLFKGFRGVVVIGDSGGLPAFLYYSRINWSISQVVLRNLKNAEESILDVGCGDGYVITNVAKEGKCVFGLDVSFMRLKRVRTKAKKANVRVELILGDAQNLPFKRECFDALICMNTLDHVPNDQIALKEMSRTLKNGGSLVLNQNVHIAILPRSKHLLQKHLPDELGHCHRYSSQSLKEDLMKTGFKITDIRGIDFFFSSENLLRTRVGRSLWNALYKLSYYFSDLAPIIVVNCMK